MSRLPISDSQLFFIMWHSLLGGASLCYHFDIKGPLDKQRLKESLKATVKAHPILRSKLKIPQSATSFKDIELHTFEREELKFNERKISKKKASEEIQAEYHRLLNRKTDLTKGALVEFTLFEFGPQMYHFFMGIDHVISDGLSSLIILHQIFSRYEGRDTPFQDAIEYSEFINLINQYEPDKIYLTKVEAYLKETRGKAFLWNPPRKNPLNKASMFRTESFILTKEETRALLNATKVLKGSVFSILVATYCEVINSIHSSSSLELTLPTSGRIYSEADLQDMVGCFAQAVTLAFRKEVIDMPFEKKVSYIEQKIQQRLLGGIDKVLTKRMATALKENYKLSEGAPSAFSKHLFQAGMKSNLYVSFTGKSPLQKQYGMLVLDNYQEGTFNNIFAIDFMHTIFDEKLHIFANYSPSFFDKELIREILSKINQYFKQSVYQSRKGWTKPALYTKDSSSQRIYLLLFDMLSDLTSLQLSEENMFDDLEGSHGIDSLEKIRLVTKIAKSFDQEMDKEQLLQSRTIYELVQVIESNQ